MKNCQCQSDLQAGWIVKNNPHIRGGKQNVPAWFCLSCGAFAQEMDRGLARLFKDRYFSIPKKKRGARSAFMRNFHYNQIKSEMTGSAVISNKRGGRAICGAPTKSGRPCLTGVRVGRRCRWHKGKQLTLF